MLSSFLLSFFRINISKIKFHRYSSLFEIISIIISFLIYFYTSKAFSLGENVFGISGLNYFEFIILGDIALMLPLYFIEAPMRNLKEAIDTKVFNTFLLLRRNTLLTIVNISYNDLFRVIVRLIISVIIVSFFTGSKLTYLHFIGVFKMFFLSLPFSLSIGLCFASVLLFFGRGSFLLGYVSVVISVFSGAFFPVTVLPEVIVESISSLIPLTGFLSTIRNSNSFSMNIIQFVFWILVFVLNIKILNFGIRKYCERGLNIVRH